MKTVEAEVKAGVKTGVKAGANAGRRAARGGKPRIAAEEFDRLFEEGDDALDAFLDPPRARRVPPRLVAPAKVNVDFPAWVVTALDREATRIGVARQALIKLWIVERLETGRTARNTGGTPAPQR